MSSNIGRLLTAVVCGALWGVAGCATQGLVTPLNLAREYQAQEFSPVKIGGLAKLGRSVEQEHRIQPGERLEVSCSDLFEENKTETFSVRVNHDGTISMPLLANRLVVQSLTAGEAEQVVRAAFTTATLIRQPRVIIRPLEPNKRVVYVIGAVKKPGAYELLEPDECDPLRAILAAGGVTDDAGGVVEVRMANANAEATSAPSLLTQAVMGPQQKGEIQTCAASVPSDSVSPQPGAAVIRLPFASEDFHPTPEQLLLVNGDVVTVEEKKKLPFYVTGSVNKPGDFPTPVDREIHVLEAVGMAGGVNMLSEPTAVVVVRRLEGKAPVSIQVDLARAARDPKENLTLMAGDLVCVQEDAVSQSRRVVREFLRVGMYFPLTLVK